MRFAKAPSDLVCKGVETDEELRLANDLMAKVHMPDYFAAQQWLNTSGAGYPCFRREHTRIALWRGELAGSLRMNSETLRLGEARLKTGGFGWVTTEPRHRHKGVCRTLMFDTLEYLRGNGYHVSLLFGIPNFYHRFGFATVLSEYEITLELEEVAALPHAAHRLRQAKPGDIPAIQRIHNALDTDVSCSLIRTSAHLTNKWAWDQTAKTTYVLTTAQGKVIAYLMAHKKGPQLIVDEAGANDPGLYEALLGACAELASTETVGCIKFLAPPAHPLARFLLQYKSTHEMRITHDEGGMMAFVSLAETLESMTPEWERLVAASALRESRAEVTLLVDGEAHRVRINRGAVDVSAVPGLHRVSFTAQELMYLLTGCRHLEDILASRRRLLTSETRAFLAAIFPRRTPYVWTFDRF